MKVYIENKYPNVFIILTLYNCIHLECFFIQIMIQLQKLYFLIDPIHCHDNIIWNEYRKMHYTN